MEKGIVEFGAQMTAPSNSMTIIKSKRYMVLLSESFFKAETGVAIVQKETVLFHIALSSLATSRTSASTATIQNLSRNALVNFARPLCG